MEPRRPLLLRRSAKESQRLLWVAAGLTFIAWGSTDFIEMQTGSWLIPWWLGAWNAGCVLAVLGYAWRRNSARRNSGERAAVDEAPDSSG